MKKYRFNLKPEHLKLLRRFSVDWDDAEFGAPCIDPKRPYGNPDVYQDMIEILGLKELREGVFEFILGKKRWILKGEDKHNLYLDGKDEEKLCDELRTLHKETWAALEVCLSSLSFDEGIYERDDYCDSWEKEGKH